ncbi:hypothetical protein FACS1894120_4290 [Clostridia bacterium]|nr:hypothetical protein FACS1894120_4290 [Clostridia bacterium]
MRQTVSAKVQSMKQMIERTGQSDALLAKKIGCTSHHFREIAAGVRTPYYKFAVAFADVLECDVEDLWEVV